MTNPLGARAISKMTGPKQDQKGQEKRLHELWDVAPVAYHILDLQGNIIDINQTEAKMMGYRKEELIGRSIFDFIVPEQRAEARQRFSRKIKGKKLAKAEDRRFLRKDGSQFYVSVDDVAEKDDQGRIMGMRTTMVDISEEKETQIALAKGLEAQNVVNKLMDLALRKISVDKMLEQALKLLTEVSWMNIEAKGGVWLANDSGRKLVLKKSYNLGQEICRGCRHVDFGRCVCGRTAELGKTIFTDRMGDIHDISYEQEGDHGHYCVPIMIEKKVLGVMNLYVKAGHKFDQSESNFLQTASNVIASFLQRQDTELALKESKDQYEQIINTIEDGIVSINARRTIVKCNHTFARKVGRPPEEIIGMNCEKILPDYEKDHLREIDPSRLLGKICGPNSVFSLKKAVSFKEKYQSQEHGEHYHAITLYPHFDGSGEVSQVVVVISDITDEVKVENQVRSLLEFNTKILENAPVSIMTLDTKGNISSANQYASSLSRQKNLLGLNIYRLDFFQREGLDSLYRALLEKGESFSANGCKTMNHRGKAKYLDIYAVPLRDKSGRVEGGLSMALDTTESILQQKKLESLNKELSCTIKAQKKNETRIRNLSEFNQKILDNLPISILTIDRQGLITAANRMAKELMEDDRQALIGQNLLDSLPIAHNRELLLLYRSLLEKGRIFYYDNLKYISREDEQAKNLNIIAVPLQDARGRVDGGISMAIDNTEAVEARDKLRELNADLEKKVLDRTKALDQANRKLSSILDLKTKFIADASHELRTPLTVIRGNLDLAQRLAQGENDSDINETHSQIIEEVDRMSHILADLSVLTSLDVDNEQMEYKEVDLSHLVKTSVRSLQVLAGQKKISLKYADFNDNIMIIGDDNKLERVFVNIIRNAIKYTQAGGTITISCSDKGSAVVRVSDTGIGIPSADLPFIFERFYRVDKARSRNEGGSGLGLSIVKWIVEAHCGRINVDSRVGIGSTFEIEIPKNCRKSKNKASLFDLAVPPAD